MSRTVLSAALALWPVLWPAVGAADTAYTICHGRYATAAEMLDAAYGKYGTLYSGGDHWHFRDNAGATIDLYRLWNGLPDLALREVDRMRVHGDAAWERAEGEPIHQVLRRALPLVYTDAAALTDDERYTIATAADLATTLGPAPGWWLPDAPAAELTPGELLTRDLARDDPFVAWLQMVLAASDAPWAHAWYLERDVPERDRFRHLSGLSLERFERGEGIEWLVAAAILASQGPNLPTLRAASVADCAASPAEYAALAVLRLEELRRGGAGLADTAPFPLPAVLQDLAFRNRLWSLMTRPQGPDRESVERLLPHLPDESLRPWANVARAWLAEGIDDLIAIHDGVPLHPVALRALNVLSVDDLLRFADAPGRDPAERAQLILVAYARLVALGRSAEAENLLPALFAHFPEQRDRMQTIAGRRWPLDLRLALIALELPDLSVWLTAIPGRFVFYDDVSLRQRVITRYGIDLPLDMRSAGFLQRDFETWLRLPDRWEEYYGMRGYSVAALDRAHDRRTRPQWSGTVPAFFPDGPDARVLPFGRLVAWDEIGGLGPRDGLSRRIGLTLIGWVENSPSNGLLRLFQPTDEMAGALGTVVRLQRQNDMGDRDGLPLGQIAFRLLHRHFPDSAAAMGTPYWFPCSLRCER